MDGSAYPADTALRLARAGLITHAIDLCPGPVPDTPFDAALETAALDALCALIEGEVFRLGPFSYGLDLADGAAQPAGEGAEAGPDPDQLPDILSAELFGRAIPGAVLLRDLAAEIGGEIGGGAGAGDPDPALQLVAALDRSARAAGGPDLRTVLDAEYALAAADITATRISERVDRALEDLNSRLRAVLPGPVAVPQAGEDPGTLSALLTEQLSEQLTGRLSEQFAEHLSGRLEAELDRLRTALGPLQEAREAQDGTGAEASAAAAQALADRLDSIGTLLADLRETAAAGREALADRVAQAAEDLGTRVDRLAERPGGQFTALRGETEGLARLSVTLQGVMRRVDNHAVDLEETIARLQARHEDGRAERVDIDARLGVIETTLVRFGEAMMARRSDPPASEKGMTRVFEALSGEIGALSERLGRLGERIDGVEGTTAPLAAAIETLGARGETRAADGQAAVETLLETRLAALEDRVATLLAPLADRPDPAGTDWLDSRFETLASLLEGLSARPGPEAALAPLATRIEARIEALDTRLGTRLGSGPSALAEDLARALAADLAGALPPAVAEAVTAALGSGDAQAQHAQLLAGVTRGEAALEALSQDLSQDLSALRLAGQETRSETAALCARIEELAGARSELGETLSGQVESLTGRLAALSERGMGDLGPLGKRLDRIHETLQGLSTRAVVAAQSLGPERARLQGIVLSLQAVAEHLETRPDTPQAPLLSEQAVSALGDYVAELITERTADLETRIAGRVAAVLPPAPGAEEDLAPRLAEALGSALGPALETALAARLPAASPGGGDPAAGFERFENRFFSEVGNLRLMLGGMRSTLGEMARARPAAGGDPELRARLDHISEILSTYLARLVQSYASPPEIGAGSAEPAVPAPDAVPGGAPEAEAEAEDLSPPDVSLREESPPDRSGADAGMEGRASGDGPDRMADAWPAPEPSEPGLAEPEFAEPVDLMDLSGDPAEGNAEDNIEDSTEDSAPGRSEDPVGTSERDLPGDAPDGSAEAEAEEDRGVADPEDADPEGPAAVPDSAEAPPAGMGTQTASDMPLDPGSPLDPEDTEAPLPGYRQPD